MGSGCMHAATHLGLQTLDPSVSVLPVPKSGALSQGSEFRDSKVQP